MCNKELGADLVMAWPSAQIAVMGAEGAANIVFKKEIKAADDPTAKKQEKIAAVSYTHLDVYKRQDDDMPSEEELAKYDGDYFADEEEEEPDSDAAKPDEKGKAPSEKKDEDKEEK